MKSHFRELLLEEKVKLQVVTTFSLQVDSMQILRHHKKFYEALGSFGEWKDIY